jgi:hypothetical protein
MGETSGEPHMNKLTCMPLSLLAVALVLGVGTAAAQTPIVEGPDFVYDVGYFANANASGAPSAQLRLTNDGHESPANLCANIYVFDTAEEMQECCSCKITPDGYLDLSVNTNLLGNILDHGTVPTRGIIKEVSSEVPEPGVCSPIYVLTLQGIKGWLTHVEKGATLGTFSLTETPLTDSFLSSEELSFNLEETCSFVQSLGTGTGVCSCADAGN